MTANEAWVSASPCCLWKLSTFVKFARKTTINAKVMKNVYGMVAAIKWPSYQINALVRIDAKPGKMPAGVYVIGCNVNVSCGFEATFLMKKISDTSHTGRRLCRHYRCLNFDLIHYFREAPLLTKSLKLSQDAHGLCDFCGCSNDLWVLRFAGKEQDMWDSESGKFH